MIKYSSLTNYNRKVRYANKHNIPFIARAGGHGATNALAQAKNAIQIDFREMNDITLSGDGEMARIGGGANVHDVVSRLTSLGKRTGELFHKIVCLYLETIISRRTLINTVTGICESVGLSAPALGGGHGWLQGQYGLMSDQVISVRLCLANGEMVTVSENENPDLFWGIRGAGHNFGLVTEWEYRVYDDHAPLWSYEIFVFSGDKLEALYEEANRLMRDQPKELVHWGYIIKVEEIDPDHVSYSAGV